MGRIVHFEVHADEPARAAKFYNDVFGWKVEKWEGPIDYWLVTIGPEDQRGIDGGIMKRQGGVDDEAVMAFVCTVDVDDLDKAIGDVELSVVR